MSSSKPKGLSKRLTVSFSNLSRSSKSISAFINESKDTPYAIPSNHKPASLSKSFNSFNLDVKTTTEGPSETITGPSRSTPINILPNELLYKIFLIHIEGAGTGEYKSDNDPNSSTDSIDALDVVESIDSPWIILQRNQRIFALIGVCRRWRDIVNGVAHLWTTLTISYKEIEQFNLSVEQLHRRWTLFADRASSLPLDVTWTSSSSRWSHVPTTWTATPKPKDEKKKSGVMVTLIEQRTKKEWMKTEGADKLGLLAQVKYHKALAHFVRDVPFSRWGTLRLLDIGVSSIPPSLLVEKNGSGFDNLTVFETRVDRPELFPLIKLVRMTARQLQTLHLRGDWESAVEADSATASNTTTTTTTNTPNNATGSTNATASTASASARSTLKSMFNFKDKHSQPPPTTGIVSEIDGIIILPKLQTLKCYNLPTTLESKFPRTITRLEVEVLTRSAWNFSCIEYLHIHRFILATAFKSRFDNVEVLRIGDKQSTGYFDYPTMGDKRVKLPSLRTIILDEKDTDILNFFDAPRLTTFRFNSPLVFPTRLLSTAAQHPTNNSEITSVEFPLTEDQIKEEACVWDPLSKSVKRVENVPALSLFATLVALSRLTHPNYRNEVLQDAENAEFTDGSGVGDVKHVTVTLDEVYDFDTSWMVSFLLAKVFTLDNRPSHKDKGIPADYHQSDSKANLVEALDLYNRRFRYCHNLETLTIRLLWSQTDRDAWVRCAETVMSARENPNLASGEGNRVRLTNLTVIWSDGKEISMVGSQTVES